MGCAANRWGGGGRGRRRRTCEILPDGGVVMRCGTQDIGTGTRTLVAMVTAETLGCRRRPCAPRSATALYPFAAGAAAA